MSEAPLPPILVNPIRELDEFDQREFERPAPSEWRSWGVCGRPGVQAGARPRVGVFVGIPSVQAADRPRVGVFVKIPAWSVRRPEVWVFVKIPVWSVCPPDAKAIGLNLQSPLKGLGPQPGGRGSRLSRLVLPLPMGEVWTCPLARPKGEGHKPSLYLRERSGHALWHVQSAV